MLALDSPRSDGAPRARGRAEGPGRTGAADQRSSIHELLCVAVVVPTCPMLGSCYGAKRLANTCGLYSARRTARLVGRPEKAALAVVRPLCRNKRTWVTQWARRMSIGWWRLSFASSRHVGVQTLLQEISLDCARVRALSQPRHFLSGPFVHRASNGLHRRQLSRIRHRRGEQARVYGGMQCVAC